MVTVIAAALAIGFAELYAEAVLIEARTRQPVGRRGVAHIARESSWVVFGAGFPALFFLIAVVGAIHLHTAIVLSKWSGLALILSYGFLAARLAGFDRGRSAIRAAAVGLIGVALIVLKAFLH
jgi:hypothetical protein